MVRNFLGITFLNLVQRITVMLRLLFVDSKTWEDAEADCVSQGGHLTTMIRLAEMNDCYGGNFSTDTYVFIKKNPNNLLNLRLKDLAKLE